MPDQRLFVDHAVPALDVLVANTKPMLRPEQKEEQNKDRLADVTILRADPIMPIATSFAIGTENEVLVICTK